MEEKDLLTLTQVVGIYDLLSKFVYLTYLAYDGAYNCVYTVVLD